MWEIITGGQAVATLAATIAGAYVAVGGLNAWRREMIGKRNIELCQKVIETFYEAEHKFQILRSPMSTSIEGKDRNREQGETQEEESRRDTLFVPLARYEKQFEFWSEFFSYRFRMRALFGERAMEAYAPVDESLREFRAVAQTNFQAQYSQAGRLEDATWRHFNSILWSSHTPDVIADRMKLAITKMEAICIPIVQQPTWLQKARQIVSSVPWRRLFKLKASQRESRS